MDLDQNATAFGRRLKAQRRALNLTQAELALLAGCAPVTIQKIEQGRRKPSQRLAERLMLQLDIALAEQPAFLAESQQQPPPPKMTARVLPPAPGTLLAGEAALAAVADLLDGGARLVTLAGAAGIGKTRLALALAQRLQRSFTHGSCFVDLTAGGAPEQVLPAIAAALQVTAHPSQLPRVLGEAVAARHGLLVLDGFEDIAAAPQVAALLQAAPRLHVLVTARAPLGLDDETCFNVKPLPLPEPDNAPENVQSSDAAQFLVMSVQARRQSFSLTAGAAAGIGAICRELGGLPLALELVATWLQDTAPESVAAALARRVEQLRSIQTAADSHELSLRVALDWSLERLAPPQRRAFARLAVFRGGFSRPAAAYVLQETADGSIDELAEESLRRLLQAGLIKRDSTTPRPRYYLVDALRPFALEVLTANGAEAAARRRHADFFALLAAQASAAHYTAEMPRWQRRLAVEQANIRAALTWCREADPALGLALATDIWMLWHLWGHHKEGAAWLAAFLRQVPEAEGLRARAQYSRGQLLKECGDFGRAGAAYEASLALWDRLESDRGKTLALIGLAETLSATQQYDRAKPLYQEAHDIAAALAEPRSRSLALRGLAAHALRAESDLDAAQRLIDQSVFAARQAKDPRHLAWTLAFAADLAIERRDLGEAARDLEEALEQFLILGDAAGQAYCKLRQACARLIVGPPGVARALLLESLQLAWDSNKLAYAVQALALIGVLNLRQSAYATGLALIAAAERFDGQLFAQLEPANAAVVEAELAEAGATLGPALIATHEAAGRAYSFAEAAAVARAAPA